MKTRTIQLLYLLLPLLTIGQYTQAREIRKISLKEAIELSLQNSKQLKLSEAKHNESAAVLRDAQNRRLPDLKATGAYMRITQPKLNLKVPLGSSSQSSGQGESSSGSSSSGFPKINEAMYGMATASLPIFAGFQIQHGIESAKYLKKAAELDVEKDKDAVVVNTIEAYCNMYKAKAALDIVKENLKESERRVSDMKNMEDNGILARNDLLKAQLQQSNVELAVLEAENNWKITYINMNLMLGLDENTQLEPDDAEFADYTDEHTFDFWEGAALQNRADIRATEFRRKAADAGVRAARGAYYPSIALTGGYIALNVPKFLTATNIVNGGIGINYSPSSLWKNGAKVAQAKARLQQTEISQQILQDAVRLDAAQTYQKYLLAVKKIDVYKTALEQATENNKIVKNKYDNSLSTTRDLLEADIALLSAKLNYAFAKADAYVAYNKLKEVTGSLNINQ